MWFQIRILRRLSANGFPSHRLWGTTEYVCSLLLQAKASGVRYHSLSNAGLGVNVIVKQSEGAADRQLVMISILGFTL